MSPKRVSDSGRRLVTISRSIVRMGIIAVAMLLMCAGRANAALVQIDFATIINQSGFLNTPFFGGFIYDDLGTGNCLTAPDPQVACSQTQSTPMLNLWLTFGAHSFGLSDLVSPSPQVILPLGSNGWGPLGVSVQPSLLPAGLTGLSLAPGTAVFTLLQFTDGSVLLDQCPSSNCTFTINSPPLNSIPGPSTLAVLAMGLALFVAGRRSGCAP
jgi:hypothetical protein